MSDLETRLRAALQAGASPSHDAMFRVEVLVRLERARFRRQVGRAVVAVVLLAVVAALSLPVIGAWVTDGRGIWFVAIAATAAVYVPFVMRIRPSFRTVTRAVGRLLYP